VSLQQISSFDEPVQCTLLCGIVAVTRLAGVGDARAPSWHDARQYNASTTIRSNNGDTLI
jgi:hypothetical protein